MGLGYRDFLYSYVFFIWVSDWIFGGAIKGNPPEVLLCHDSNHDGSSVSPRIVAGHKTIIAA